MAANAERNNIFFEEEMETQDEVDEKKETWLSKVEAMFAQKIGQKSCLLLKGELYDRLNIQNIVVSGNEHIR